MNTVSEFRAIARTVTGPRCGPVERAGGDRVNWRKDAACREAAPGLFHPPPPPRGDPGQALAYCRRCSVVADCARHSLTIGVPGGIAAGVWPAGDRDSVAQLRVIATGRGAPRRCVRCWRLIPGSSGDRLCGRCGFAEIPV
ncbi:WhiB family transcriptional regulator [Nocardia wallacei]|uniref:WhiB family transcriptional regulator n=1 Tax=Nocardia wallacei TaxID=480035 RepID=UPI003CC7D298